MVLDGSNEFITPSLPVTLTHAVQQPLGLPTWTRLPIVHEPPSPVEAAYLSNSFSPITAWRSPGSHHAVLLGALQINGASTAAVDLEARWIEWLDDLSEPGPTQTPVLRATSSASRWRASTAGPVRRGRQRRTAPQVAVYVPQIDSLWFAAPFDQLDGVQHAEPARRARAPARRHQAPHGALPRGQQLALPGVLPRARHRDHAHRPQPDRRRAELGPAAAARHRATSCPPSAGTARPRRTPRPRCAAATPCGSTCTGRGTPPGRTSCSAWCCGRRRRRRPADRCPARGGQGVHHPVGARPRSGRPVRSSPMPAPQTFPPRRRSRPPTSPCRRRRSSSTSPGTRSVTTRTASCGTATSRFDNPSALRAVRAAGAGPLSAALDPRRRAVPRGPGGLRAARPGPVRGAHRRPGRPAARPARGGRASPRTGPTTLLHHRDGGSRRPGRGRRPRLAAGRAGGRDGHRGQPGAGRSRSRSCSRPRCASPAARRPGQFRLVVQRVRGLADRLRRWRGPRTNRSSARGWSTRRSCRSTTPPTWRR